MQGPAATHTAPAKRIRADLATSHQVELATAARAPLRAGGLLLEPQAGRCNLEASSSRGVQNFT